MSKTAINMDVSALQNFKGQSFHNQTSDHHGSYVLFAHFSTLFQAVVSGFKLGLLQI